ncbi:MAG: polysaccharide biosynthesis protein [Bacilli bacterium]|jgi:FlaA1/EpsC-like NDP-sugar epimerase|nr:polysaccharide biosynthesis protein [Bacilli bacterium]
MKAKNLHLLGVVSTVLADCISVFLVLFLCAYGSFDKGQIDASGALALTLFSLAFFIALFLVFALSGVYKYVVDDYGFHEAVIVALITLGVGLIAFIVMLSIPTTYLPHYRISIFLLAIATLMFLCCGFRGIKRLIRSAYVRYIKQKNMAMYKRTIVVGAGSAAKIVIDDSRNNLDSKSHVIALVDDNPAKIGGKFSSLPILGPIKNIQKIIAQYKIDEVIIAIQDLSKERLSEILSYLRDADVQVRRLPVLSELGSVNERTVLNIDINEILGRPQIVLDNSSITNMLHGKCVLVTGAGGSIGSELVRQIYKTHPSTLVLFDIYENGVYAIQQELVREIKRDKCQDIKLVTLIGATYNQVRMEQVFSQYKPDYVYHAAAYKHVPLMEESPAEAVRSNIIGTYNVASLCDKYGTKKMLLVSTDKAVRPTNAMGATKRFAEMIIQHFSTISKNTKYCAVRFGNVLGSNGSVIPLFAKQIEEGGPVTVTDPNIIRYFMTIPEAVGLILQSSLFASGGEIFILDMGKPVKIVDLAKKMIRQAGFIPDKDIKIVYSGLRPGEKLFEETLLDPTKQDKTSNDKIYIEHALPFPDVDAAVKQVSNCLALKVTPNDVKEMIKQTVDTYKPEMDD